MGADVLGEMASVYLQAELWIMILYTIVMSAFLTYIVINSKRSQLLFSYSLVHALTILMVISSFASTIAPNLKLSWYFISISCLIKLFYDIMFLRYARCRFKPVYRILSLIVVTVYISAGSVIIFTNPFHYLFLKAGAQGDTSFGVLFFGIMAAGVVFEIVGMLMIVKHWVRRLDNQSFRVKAASIAILDMLILHLYLTKLIPMTVDILPILILGGFFVYFIGATKYGMFGTISGNSMRGLEVFTDILVVTDKKGAIIYNNKAANQLEETTFRDILCRFRTEIEQKPSKGREIKADIVLSHGEAAKYYSVAVKPVKARIFRSGQLVYLIHDNTENVMAINLLSERNQYLYEMNDSMKTMAEDSMKLAVLSERNILAKEIHDVVGHSLVLALNTMESNKLLLDNRPAAMRRIRQAVDEINGSLQEIEIARSREPMQNQDSETGCAEHSATEHSPTRIKLSEKLPKLATRLSESGISMEIISIDNLDGCDDFVVKNIYRICQESVTNAIKHGKASKISISLKKKNTSIELYVIDNGKGCVEISKGTGLSSMEERVQRMNGVVSFSSFELQAKEKRKEKETIKANDENSPGSGFMVRVTVPI